MHILNVGSTGHARGDQRRIDAGFRILAGTIDPREYNVVCAGQCSGETLRKNMRTRVEMRLEDNRDRSPIRDDATGEPCP